MPAFFHPTSVVPVAVGIPVKEAAKTTSYVTASGHDSDSLRDLGYPPGLANEIYAELELTPLRFWIVDNSGSMCATDGKRLRNGHVLTSSRTLELQDAVTHQAELAIRLQARTDFHHLNVPRGGAKQFITVASGTDASGCKRSGITLNIVDAATQALEKSIVPCGGTPLTEAVNHIHAVLAPLAARMREKGQQSVVVIATDGLPNNPATFLQALQLLQLRCPVWVVVRLCTSSESITSYWTSLDKDLERPLEVLDDVFGEATEVAQQNRWLTYAPQLHAARLFGLHNRMFDMLDERPLPPSEIKRFCEALLGCKPLPEPEMDAERFVAALRLEVAQHPPVFDPRRREMRPWVDVDAVAFLIRARQLGRKFGPLGCCMAAMVK